jgi:hypothetical protein
MGETPIFGWFILVYFMDNPWQSYEKNDDFSYGQHHLWNSLVMHVSMRKAPFGKPIWKMILTQTLKRLVQRNDNEQMPKECGDYINNLE